MGKSDSSVVVALSELVRMEESRIEEERASRAAQEAERVRMRELAEREAHEAEQRRVESAAKAALALEAEARMRLEADRDQGKRIEAMRAELARAVAERSALHASLEARMAAPSDAPRVRGWAMAFGVSSLVAASLAALLVVNAQEARVVAAPAPAPAPAALVREVPIAVAVPSEAPPAAAAEEVAPQSAAPQARGTRPIRGHGHRPTTDPTESATGDDLGLGSDDGSDDVLSPEILRHAEHETAPRAHH